MRKDIENQFVYNKYRRNSGKWHKYCREEDRQVFSYGNVIVSSKLNPAVEIVATTLGIEMNRFQMFLKFSDIHTMMMVVTAMFAQM